jgi:anti-anti-sigma factor
MEQIEALIVHSGQHQNLITVKLTGTLNLQTMTPMEKAVNALDGICRGKAVLFDMTEVNYISSSGWSLFLTAYKRLRDQHSVLALVGMGQEVLNIFEILDFGRLIPHYQDFPTAEKGVLVLLDRVAVQPHPTKLPIPEDKPRNSGRMN